jgi:hypothetical protein
VPGVTVTTEVIPGPSADLRAPGSTYFVVGITERGPTDKAVKIRSLSDYEYNFGPRVSYGALHDDLRTFFAEGGGRAYVARIVGAAATKATRTLQDRDATPDPTLRIDAVDVGVWGATITVEVQNGTDANTYKLIVKYASGAVSETETYDNLATPAAGVTALAKSRWVRAVDLSSPTAPPNNNPVVLAASALTGGADDRAAIVAADYKTYADNRFTKDLGPGAIAVPGQVSSAVGAGLRDHSKDRNRIALLAVASGASIADAKVAATALAGTTGSEHAGIFYPWVTIPATVDTTRDISPEGFVAAMRARAHELEGPWRAPAGGIAEARFVLGLQKELTRTEGDDLDLAKVNAIRKIAGSPRTYGWRSLSNDLDNWALLTGREVLNVLVHQAEEMLEDYVFRSIDGKGHLFKEVEGELLGLAEPMRAKGGLYERRDPETGDLIDPGYKVDTSAAVNTPASIAAGEVKATLAVRVSPTGTLIKVTIAKAAVTAQL